MPSPSAVAAETNKYRKVVIIANSGRPVAGASPVVMSDFDAASGGLVHLGAAAKHIGWGLGTSI
jgi:hypothetical protein